MDNMVSSPEYSEIVAQLLTLRTAPSLSEKWLDYGKLGLTVADIPELIRMATDMTLHQAYSDTTEVWAPLHAWRALGQLRAESAVEPLIGLFHLVDDEDNDWVAEDLPDAFGMIGESAIPALTAYVRDSTHGLWAHSAACTSLIRIAEHHPDAHEVCVAALTGLLERFAENDPEVNAYLISGLIDLDAVESASVMEQAFKANAVDLSMQGDWEEAQIELGLLEERITPAPPYGWLGEKFHNLSANNPIHHDHSSPGQQMPPRQYTAKPGANAERNRRKAQRKARKKKKRK